MNDAASAHRHFTIALNRDSLETWFLAEFGDGIALAEGTCEIIADDQELTLDYFKNGLVSACLSTQSKALKGAEAIYLGPMKYLMVATKEFLARYEWKRDAQAFFKNAPALQFDSNDNLHERYLKHYFPELDSVIPYQIIPSVAGFKKFALLGLGYGLIPEIDIIAELKNKKLINMLPNRLWEIHLYWHMWSIKSAWYEKINADIIRSAQKRFGGRRR
jgi:LysR family transcriptional regulator (chromosome initiation inhibitor)